MSKTVAVISSHTQSLFWFRMNMMQDFAAQGYRVIALGQESEAEWKDKFAENKIEYKQIYVERNGLNPLKDIKTLKQLKQFMKEEKPDKVFCYQAKTIIYSCIAARLNNIKEVYPLVAGLGSVFRGSGLKNKIVKMLMVAEYKIALKNSRYVMFQNNDDLGAFVSNRIVPKSKCKIINGSGVDTDKFVVYSLPEKTAFLMISRLIKDKGVIEYLEACRCIKKTNPDIRCMNCPKLCRQYKKGLPKVEN